ncbi:MAG TPA: DUF2510 domain-containing protein [Dactylosporangium sp.]|nr:DUF2510 domain-containing protein [Dactylosporangium sp.]
MRGFLLWVASMIVGLATCLVALGFWTQPQTHQPMWPGFVIWAVAFLAGMLISAPYFLNPTTVGGWSITLPWPLAMMLWIFLAIRWVGRMILYGAWLLLFLLWPKRRPAGPSPFSRSPSGSSGGGPGAPGRAALDQAPQSASPGSWRADPTGRYAQRYWDGARWTAHVMNGSHSAIDPP